MVEVIKRLVANAPTHCYFYNTEPAGAVQDLATSNMDELGLFGEAVEALLSTSSSDEPQS